MSDKEGVPLGLVRYAIWGQGNIAQSLRNIFFALWKGYVWAFVFIMLFCNFEWLQWPLVILVVIGWPVYTYYLIKWDNARQLATLRAQIAADHAGDKVSLD
jgi:hypothetical protein